MARPVPPARAAPAAEADSLHRRAVADIARNTVEGRRAGMLRLERATALAPDRADYELELARLYYRMGFLKMARNRYQRVERLRPEDPDARIGLGTVWRRDWLKYLDRASLARAIEHFTVAAQRRPREAEPWLQLVPLLIEDGRLSQAADCANRAYEADRALPDAVLAVAHTAYRLGQVERADSAFRSVLPRLPRNVRERYDDIAPVASEQDTAIWRRLPTERKAEFVRRFWKENDPDLGTLENEAQLEYWSRVTQAYFLFYDARRREWDERGEVYVRYGPPEKAEYNPVGARNVFSVSDGNVVRSNGLFPMNTLVWSYPQLGMSVSMEDRVLTEFYLRPISLARDTDPAPDPDSLARRDLLLPTRGGRGVFPKLPPGARPLEVDGVLARFEGARGPRLLGLLQTPAAPSESLYAEWVVIDTAQAEIARVRRDLGASACDPGELRVADFFSDLPPGRYLAGLSVRDGRGGRGLVREAIELEAAHPELALSDVVVSCGTPAVEPGTAEQPPAVRLQANPGSRVHGAGPLTVYFEIYHLQPDASGVARLEFEYVVRSAERDRRVWVQRMLAPRPALPLVSATRRDEQPGDLRRQFVTVPVQSLPVGRYRLDIRVRDLNAGVERSTATIFVKEPAGPAGS